jgi:hypothetical protein
MRGKNIGQNLCRNDECKNPCIFLLLIYSRGFESCLTYTYMAQRRKVRLQSLSVSHSKPRSFFILIVVKFDRRDMVYINNKYLTCSVSETKTE